MAATAREPASGASYLVAPRDLTPPEIDDLAARAINAVGAGSRGVEFKSEEVHGFSLNLVMTQEQFENIKDGKERFYLIYVMSHRDETVPIGKVRMTEACYVYVGGLEQGLLCPEHNRTFIADSPPPVR